MKTAACLPFALVLVATACSDTIVEEPIENEETLEEIEARLAADPDKAHFTVMGTPLAVPVPNGFCKPTEAMAEEAEKDIELDTSNYTVGHFIACDAEGNYDENRYVLLKSPREHPGGSIEKEAALAELDEFMSSQSGQAELREAIDGRVADISRRSGGQTGMNINEFGYSGRDADCVYMAGPMAIATPQGRANGNAATCVTVAKNRMISINVYDFSGNPTSFNTLKSQARAIGNSTIYDDERFL